MTTWAEPHVTRLKKLWAEGFSAGDIRNDINIELRTAYTRNAIIGQVHRLGLSGRAKVVFNRPAPVPKTARLPSQAGNTGAGDAQRLKSRIKHDARRAGGKLAPTFNAATVAARAARSAIAAGTDIGPVKAPSPLPRRTAKIEIPVEQRRTLLELTETTCRWPVGEPLSPDFFFCGALEADNPARPYCHHHTRVAAAH